MSHEIQRYTSTDVTQVLNLMTPEIAIKQSAVQKQGDWTAAALDIGNVSRWYVNELPLRFEFDETHFDMLCGCESLQFTDLL